MDPIGAARDTVTVWALNQGQRPLPNPVRNEHGRGLAHARWMLEQIMCDRSMNTPKCHRWLGYAQALLVQSAIVTLEQMKAVNKQN